MGCNSCAAAAAAAAAEPALHLDRDAPIVVVLKALELQLKHWREAVKLHALLCIL